MSNALPSRLPRVHCGYALGEVVEPGESQRSVRLGRCANHPTASAVGVCDVCGKAICVSCAVPVRGRLVCHESLGVVLEDLPVPPPSPHLRSRGGWGDGLAIVGFGLVVLVSVFPWTRFGDSSGYLKAWLPHWSLVAVGGSALGLAFAVRALRRMLEPRLVALVYAGMGLIVAGASMLHRRHPPGAPLASATASARLALLGALIALVGGALKASSTIRSGRSTP